MLVRFVGGPYNGKRMDINPDPLIRTQGITVSVMSKRKADRIDMSSSTWPPAVGIPFKEHRYHIRMMYVKMGQHTYEAPAMHPDGSLFLVHENYGKRKR